MVREDTYCTALTPGDCAGRAVDDGGLCRASKRHRARLYRLGWGSPTRPTGWLADAILRHLAEAPMTSAELARTTRASGASVRSRLNELLHRGAIMRSGMWPTGKRGRPPHTYMLTPVVGYGREACHG